MPKNKTKKEGSSDDKKGKGGKGGKGDASAAGAAKAAAFTDETPQRAFEHFRPLAEAVAAADLPIFTGQPLLLLANVRTALEAMDPHWEKAAGALRDHKLHEVFELPSLVMALDFAVGRVPIAKLSAGEIEKMLSEGAPWRELMLSYLEIASHPLVGLLPRERVAAVRAGSGKLDKAQDFVAIPGLFAEFQTALAGKHPFPASTVDLLATLGGALLQQLRPGAAPTPVAKRTSESILRDKFAHLVTERYDHLQVLAAVALGKRKADALLPALRSSAPAAPPASSPPVEPAKGAAPSPG